MGRSRRSFIPRVAASLLGTFYVSMVAAGYLIEIGFGALHLTPGSHAVNAVTEALSWNYTTFLNIVFLLISAALVYRFLPTPGIAMLEMMNTPTSSAKSAALPPGPPPDVSPCPLHPHATP